MCRMSRALCCIAALSAAGSWATAAEPGRQNITIDNVVVELSATPEGVTACVDAVHGTKLSGPLRRRDHSAIRPRRLAGEAAEDRCGRRGLFRPAAAHRAEAAGGRGRRRAAAIRSR